MIPFIDLAAQQARLKPRIDAAIARVLAHGQYVMGPEVREFEDRLARFGRARRALSCANGTDALALPLMAWEIGPGDAVFCPSFTFAATAEAIAWTGAQPVFVDIDPDTYTLDPEDLAEAIAFVRRQGVLRPRAVVAVDLFGQTANYPVIATLCRQEGLKLLSDAAQAFGATLHDHQAAYWADAVATSFFPAKPLGCYGDGGAVLTNDDALWTRMDSLRIHGKAVEGDPLWGDHDPKYLNARVGMNSRLDTLQAAILIEKLAVFEDELAARERIAARYGEGLPCRTPQVIAGGRSSWAQYVIEHDERDGLAVHLKTQGVPTAVYYPAPMHRQAPYRTCPRGADALPVSDAKAEVVLALPMHAYLDHSTQDYILEAVRGFNG
jgi:dTDP-4-amino-4,6-dideoxygalactose transaminase